MSTLVMSTADPPSPIVSEKETELSAPASDHETTSRRVLIVEETP
jgi:hypothetical protein